MARSDEQFWKASAKLENLAASPAAGITTSANALKLRKMPYCVSPLRQSDVPSAIVAALMSTFCSTLFSLIPKAGLSIMAMQSRLKASLSHSPVRWTTVASFNEEGMSEASTVYSVEGAGVWSSSCSWLQPSSAAKRTYCSWFSLSVTPESSTPSNMLA